MISTESAIEKMTHSITEEIQVQAPIEVTFATLLEQLGPFNEVAENRPLPMKLEPWPGGRWYRDLGESNGHFWGHVQAIKRPTLLEISGPLIMSYPISNNLQYRLSEREGGTLIKFHHLAFGLLREDDRHVNDGWKYTLARLRERAEAAVRDEKASGR
jgi:Activator of Hsp90 ATPase homolog 1-like protein